MRSHIVRQNKRARRQVEVLQQERLRARQREWRGEQSGEGRAASDNYTTIPPINTFSVIINTHSGSSASTPASAAAASATVSVLSSATVSRLQSLPSAPAPALISAPLSNLVYVPVCGAGFVSDSVCDAVSVPGSLIGLVSVCIVALISPSLQSSLPYSFLHSMSLSLFPSLCH